MSWLVASSRVGPWESRDFATANPFWVGKGSPFGCACVSIMDFICHTAINTTRAHHLILFPLTKLSLYEMLKLMENLPPTNLYPTLSVSHIQNPNRFFAFPVIGILVKLIMIIPVGFELLILYIANIFVTFANSFMVLFNGVYWDTAYNLNLGIMRLMTKTYLFIYGLTDKYPGFDLTIQDPLITLDMKKPETPNRLFAIPLLGGLARVILLIPYLIYQSVLNYAVGLGVIISSFPVLFTGRYPETTYEFTKDYMRIVLASTAYMTGFSDSYPSFWISMNHKTAKVLLIIFGVLLFIANMFSSN